MCSEITRVLQNYAAVRCLRLSATGYWIAGKSNHNVTNGKIDLYDQVSEEENLVPRTGIEPARLSTLDPKSSASANFATSALEF